MANDPNRDLLPVKENYNRPRQGPSERFDHQTLSKLSRPELEDKVHRLLDEHTHLKKLANCQEEKIKRLGTKLLRLINDKKPGGKNVDQGKIPEDIHFQFVELEHENYALKDKITVLRQQLASQSRQNIIRSPVRSNHTSPPMSVRQSAPNFQNEVAYQSANKASTSDVQLQEAEAHIKLLNNEIKSLHNKIEYLQQDLEKNSLDNRKTKVTENIEFIRLQRSLKQQAIQIAALQAQIKNSETSQNVLKEELIKAHNENDEALHLIATKQNEILNLCSKLEEENLNRLEENDLKQRINDLMLERNSLKERADLLLKTIEEKTEETEKAEALKALLAQEKSKTEKLEKILGAKEVYCRNNNVSCQDSESNTESTETQVTNIPLVEKKEEHCLLDTSANSREILLKNITYEELEKKDGWTSPMQKFCYKECKGIQTETINSRLVNEKDSEDDDVAAIDRDGREKIKLELEVQHLREMLRSQTSRCEAQQNEINRLMVELKLSEDRFKSTINKLDKRLSAFENLELLSRKEAVSVPKKSSPIRSPPSSFKPIPVVRSTQGTDESIPEFIETINGKSTLNQPEKIHKKLSLSREDSISERLSSSNDHILAVAKSISPVENSNNKKRFVDQVFLESSDEEQSMNVHSKEPSRDLQMSGSEELDSDMVSRNKSYEGKQYVVLKSSKMHLKRSIQSDTPISSPARLSTDFIQEKKTQTGAKGARAKAQSGREEQQKVLISIIWLEIDPDSSLWDNDFIKLLFVDFTFLDLRGESTETPDSLPKPNISGQKCKFNFVKEVEIDENRRKILSSLLSKPDMDLIIFKVVSDCEEDDHDFECEDIGVAVVTVKQFLDKYNKGLFTILVNNIVDTKEVIGKLAISIEITPGLLSPRN